MEARWIDRRMAVALFLAISIALLSAGHAAAADPHPYSGSDTIIASSSTGERAVTLDLVGSQGGANSGFNFNGFANGDMIINVPEGWKVTVDFRVESSLSHSAIIVPFSQRKAFSFTPAFPGSGIPDYSSGINKSDPPAHFSFTADKAGRYAIVCAVPGHDAIGMWDEFDVVKGLPKPEVLVK